MKHQHKWFVFSTSLGEKCLMLQCTRCGAFGTVDDPSQEEWGEAFRAPSNPYWWPENSRVNTRNNNEIYKRPEYY